jgi:hypothetical protein
VIIARIVGWGRRNAFMALLFRSGVGTEVLYGGPFVNRSAVQKIASMTYYYGLIRTGGLFVKAL